MKCEFKYFIAEPAASELEFLLGAKIYSYYCSLHESILCFLKPDLQIWDNAGRRGKYFHGYTINKRHIIFDIYLIKDVVKCELKIPQKEFDKIVDKKEIFSEQIKNSIERRTVNKREYGHIYFEFLVDKDIVYNDVITTIKLLA